MCKVGELRAIGVRHRCRTPLVTLVRKPSSYVVSHHIYMNNVFYSKASPELVRQMEASIGRVNGAEYGGLTGYKRSLLSFEAYAAELKNHQTKWLMSGMHSSELDSMTSQALKVWVSKYIDVLGTTDRMGDFIRATCQAAGLPARLCLTTVGHDKDSDHQGSEGRTREYCLTAMKYALRANDTRVLSPQGPPRTLEAVALLCRDPSRLYDRITNSQSIADAVQLHSPLDGVLYDLATDAAVRWRNSVSAEWLSDHLAADYAKIRYKVAAVSYSTNLTSNEKIVRICQPHACWKTKSLQLRNRGSFACVLQEISTEEPVGGIERRG